MYGYHVERIVFFTETKMSNSHELNIVNYIHRITFRLLRVKLDRKPSAPMRSPCMYEYYLRKCV